MLARHVCAVCGRRGFRSGTLANAPRLLSTSTRVLYARYNAPNPGFGSTGELTRECKAIQNSIAAASAAYEAATAPTPRATPKTTLVEAEYARIKRRNRMATWGFVLCAVGLAGTVFYYRRQQEVENRKLVLKDGAATAVAKDGQVQFDDGKSTVAASVISTGEAVLAKDCDSVPTGTSSVPLFPRTVRLTATGEEAEKGDEYDLLGLGIRTVSLFGIQVYVVGLYVAVADIVRLQEKLIRTIDDTATTLVSGEKDKLRQKLLDPVEGEDVWNAIVKGGGIRTAWRIVPTRSTDVMHMRDGFVRGITARSNHFATDRADQSFQDEDFGKSVNDFKTVFGGGSRKKIPKKEVLYLIRDARGTLAAFLEDKNGERIWMGSVGDERVSRLLWLNYLAGKSVSSEEARRNVVEGPSPRENTEGLSSPQVQAQVSAQDDNRAESSEGHESGSDAKAQLPIQKRRRVTRACDECRRKKIKCDGKQPCTHCTVYSYDCTYDQPSNRRRNPAPQYIEALEQRLQKAEAILRKVLPDLNLDDPKFDAHGPGEEDVIRPMVDRVGSLDLDDQGNWDFHGHSSGFAFMRKFRAQFGEQYLPFPPNLRSRNMNYLLESPRSVHSSPFDSNASATIDLPSKEVAIELCRNALDDCCALMRPVHRPTFFRRLHSIYETEPEQYSSQQLKFLPVLYVVMGLGCLFSRPNSKASLLDHSGYREAMEQGYQYFNAGKQMLNITECRDLLTIQCVFFMIIFLQSSARLQTCYSYIGVGLRACCRLGLHRDLPNKFNAVETEERKRIFWLIRKIDTYVGAILGLPRMLSDDDIDQKLPEEVDDNYITEDGISPMPDGLFPLIKATNAHTKLTFILRKVVRYVYPVKGSPSLVSGDYYTVSHSHIRELEQDLQAWMHELPMQLRPSDDVGMEQSRVQQLLRISYAHVQMMMYRPFILYVSPACQTEKADRRSFAYAAACVSVARNIVHITTEMKRRGLLSGAYWFVIYTTYFAIVSLVYFVLENSTSLTSEEILKDALEGRDTLASLAKRNLAADRCTTSLASLFNELPEKLRERRSTIASPSLAKKRQAPGDSTKSSINRSRTSLNSLVHEPPAAPTRSRTLPHDFIAKMSKLNSMPEPSPPALSNPQIPQLVGISSPLVGQPLSQQFDFTTQMSSSHIPDLKNFMFSSDNPFAYPNQPLAALESADSGFCLENLDSFPNSNDHSKIGTPPNIHNSAQAQPFDMNAFQRLYEEGPELLQHMSTGRSFNTLDPTGYQGLPEAGDQQQSDQQQQQSQDLQQPWNIQDGVQPQDMQQQGQHGEQDDYWSQINKGNIGTRTGFTPGASMTLDELFGGEPWGRQEFDASVFGGNQGINMSGPS
ncbi:hypothetical protein DV736_g4116, partial [Chaetothyriales sp. CBS 134916]